MNAPVPRSASEGYRLNQGPTIPCLGLGVFQVEPGATTRQAVLWGLRAGYRHIDTAKLYANEADVGEAVRTSGVPRAEVFVTTKLWHTDHGFDAAQAAFRASLGRLNLGYIDLYLIHWPTAPSPEVRRESWRALERIQTQGLCRAIGVSNYSVHHLAELREHSDVVPAVDQVEMHPFVYDPELLDYCSRHGIRVEAYSPLTRGRRLDHPVFAQVARAHGRSVAQVLLRWGLQHGLVELPRSVHEERIRENAAIFDFSLTDQEMARLDDLRGGPRVTTWNPVDIP
jgi:diketogulonate reductase-like aldo/keto reductase